MGKKAILALIKFILYNLVQSQAGFTLQVTGETGKEVWVFNMMFGKDVIIGDVCQELNDWQLRHDNSIVPSTSLLRLWDTVCDVQLHMLTNDFLWTSN